MTSSGQRDTVVDSGLLARRSPRLAVIASNATSRNASRIQAGNGAVDPVPHTLDALGRRGSQQVFLYLATAALSALPKHVAGCSPKCFVATIPTMYGLHRAIQQCDSLADRR